RAGVRLRPRAAARGVRQLSRRARLPAAAADAPHGGARRRLGGRRTHRRTAGVLRARRLRADRHLRSRATAGRRPCEGPGDRGGGAAGGRGARGSRRQPPHHERVTTMTSRTMDPILLEVLRNRLDAIADEMELTLLKSAASPIVKEGLDASAALFNVKGETIAQ